MKLITKAILKKLQDNFHKQDQEDLPLKLFNPCGSQTWLINSLEDDGDTMWGLADLGFGCVEWGTISLNEISQYRNQMGLGIERDRWWKNGKVKDFISKEYLAGC
jgi:hypothetical protein